jgi:predicted nucleic acid-binding protein
MSGPFPYDRPFTASDGAAPSVAFVDASALIALADRDDASHQAALAAYEEFVAGGFRLFTSDLAFVAAHALLGAACGSEPAARWLEHCRITIYYLTAADLDQGRQALLSGANGPGATLADAVHLAVLDRLGVTDVFAVDRRFLALLG